MADVAQLQADVAALQQAVSDDQAAVQAVQAFAQSQAVLIADLEQQVETLKLQQGGAANLDLSALEGSIQAIKDQNLNLRNVVPAPPVTTEAAPQANAASASSNPQS